jgi:hypothetical protein
VKLQKEMIERLHQQLAAREEECAMAAKRKVLYDQESQTVARLKDRVGQNIRQQNEQTEKKLLRYG